MDLESKLPKASEYREELQKVKGALVGYRKFRKRQIRALKRLGLAVEKLKSEHYRVYWPENPCVSYTFSATPRSPHAGMDQYMAMRRTLFDRD